MVDPHRINESIRETAASFLRDGTTTSEARAIHLAMAKERAHLHQKYLDHERTSDRQRRQLFRDAAERESRVRAEAVRHMRLGQGHWNAENRRRYFNALDFDFE